MNLLRKFITSLMTYRTPLRPPGALEEAAFLKKCIRCNKCVQICPYDSIIIEHSADIDTNGTPIIIPREIPCYLCMECPPVCPTGALDNEVLEKEQVRMGVAEINQDTCLPYMGIICRACFENCPIFREAIILKDEMYPEIVAEKCIGCGICEKVCPVDNSAIIVKKTL